MSRTARDVTNCNRFFCANMHERVCLYVFEKIIPERKRFAELSTGFSTPVDNVDESCGYPVDIGDNLPKPCGMARFSGVLPVENPVEAVDDTSFGCV